MNLSHLKRASDWEVRDWLIDNLQLTPYQKGKLYDDEIIRFSPFYFYKSVKEKSSPIWRLTLPFFILYYLLAIIWVPFNFLFTGRWGYGRWLMDKFHGPWARKIGL